MSPAPPEPQQALIDRAAIHDVLMRYFSAAERAMHCWMRGIDSNADFTVIGD